MKQKSFTLIELLIVIAVIGLMASIVLVLLQGVRGKARDARRVNDLKQLYSAFNLYFADKDSFPSIPGFSFVCIGVPSNQTCWGDRNVPGSDSLILNLQPYIASLPSDPLPNRGWGDRYLYSISSAGIDYGCNGTNDDTGKFILWRPDKAQPTADVDCLKMGRLACCGSGPCYNNGGFYCAYKIGN